MPEHSDEQPSGDTYHAYSCPLCDYHASAAHKEKRKQAKCRNGNCRIRSFYTTTARDDNHHDHTTARSSDQADRVVDREVYSVNPTVETNHQFESEHTSMRVEGLDSTWRVDEICDGRVLLVNSAEGGNIKASSLGDFAPDESRALGEALINAADWAEKQMERMDNE